MPRSRPPDQSEAHHVDRFAPQVLTEFDREATESAYGPCVNQRWMVERAGGSLRLAADFVRNGKKQAGVWIVATKGAQKLEIHVRVSAAAGGKALVDKTVAGLMPL